MFGAGAGTLGHVCVCMDKRLEPTQGQFNQTYLLSIPMVRLLCTASYLLSLSRSPSFTLAFFLLLCVFFLLLSFSFIGIGIIGTHVIDWMAVTAAASRQTKKNLNAMIRFIE